jgi:hypothetical protein
MVVQPKLYVAQGGRSSPKQYLTAGRLTRLTIAS